jgi:hypothetical protein
MKHEKRISLWISGVLAVAIAFAWLTALSRHALAEKVYNLTENNAPRPAHLMYLTEEEFRGLFANREKPNAGFCKVPCSHRLIGTREDGRPFIRGEWLLDKKTGKLDLEYRPGRSTLENGNPYFCHVTAVYRYAPPEAEQPRSTEHNQPPYRRLDMDIFASINAGYTAQAIREWKERDAKRYREEVKDPKSSSYSYRYIEDLGFGLDRNDMYVMLNRTGKSCQVFIKLDSAKPWLHADIFLNMEDGAVSQERAISIARNAAAIIAKKGFGANAKVDMGKEDEAGFTDVWTADRIGKMPEEDHHENRIRLGKLFYVVCAYKLPEAKEDVEISLWMMPGADAVAASRERCERVKSIDSIYTTPLESKMRRDMEKDVTHTADRKCIATGPVSVRTLADGTFVASFTIITADPMEPFIIGPGAWEMEVLMQAYRHDPGNEEGRTHMVEISKRRIAVTIVDDPEFSAKVLKPPEKATSTKKKGEKS